MKRTPWLRALSGSRDPVQAGVAARKTEKPPEVVEIPAASILFSPFQPREDAGGDIAELCESIKTHGLIQPVVVRRTGAGYELVAGERRVRACKMAGVERIPAIVRDYDDRASALAALIENVQREDLRPLEEAEAYCRLSAEFGLTQEQVAQAVGLSQPAVANKIRLLRLPEEVKDALRSGAITERHARALLRLESKEAQLEALGSIVRQRLTVQESEALVEGSVENATPRGRRKKLRLRVFKDARLFVNSFRSAVGALRRAGLDATLEERESEGFIEVVMRIPKPKRTV
ncbi:MAG: ParB/RepB/Spo0J family partition protein [Firmicutes bacterium]|nr:ParB/RepB/Spo0J family partition protein [Bacillota bacterium]